MENTPAVEQSQTLAGFRLVRRIGTGSRSTVHLGLAVGEQSEARSAALKIFRVDADRPALDRQVRAMLGVPPAMLANLRDVATAPDGRLCLVLDRLAGSSLQRLLDDRGRIGAGEAVTILATITATLQALHDAGFSHAMVGPACVWFDDCGRPVLLGLGALGDLPAGGAGVARRRDDLVRLAGFARAVLDRVDPRSPESGSAGPILTAFESTATARPLPRDLTGLEADLFEWAPATAVRGAMPGVRDTEPDEPAVSPDGSQPGFPPRPAIANGTRELRSRQTWMLPGARPSSQAANSTAAGTGQGAHPDGSALAGRRRPLRPLRPLVPLLRRWTAGSRSRVRAVRSWTLATGGRGRAQRSGGVAPAGALPGGARSSPRVVPRPAIVGACLAAVLASGAWAALTWAEAPSGPGVAAEASAGPPVSPSASPPVGAGSADPALVADDPAAATLALLQLRDECLAAASVLCLDGVDQAGSVAMAADTYQARQAEDGAGGSAGDEAEAVARTEVTATVQERRGNAALIILTPVTAAGQNTQPASALVIKGEAGWRLRELFDY